MLGGWVRKAENKVDAQYSWGFGFAELGKKLLIVLWHDLGLNMILRLLFIFFRFEPTDSKLMAIYDGQSRLKIRQRIFQILT